VPTIPQRIASAFAVFCGRYGDVTEMAQDREQSRQALYREAEQVANAVDGTASQARIDELQQQLAQRQAEIQALQDRLKHAVEISPDTQHEFASVSTTGWPSWGWTPTSCRRCWTWKVSVASRGASPPPPEPGR
jgi:hypothetical protein